MQDLLSQIRHVGSLFARQARSTAASLQTRAKPRDLLFYTIVKIESARKGFQGNLGTKEEGNLAAQQYTTFLILAAQSDGLRLLGFFITFISSQISFLVEMIAQLKEARG